jgi:hypothetical protein
MARLPLAAAALSVTPKQRRFSAMTRYPKLRAIHAFHDRHCAMLSGDEPDHYRTYGVIPACGNVAATNALADLFTAAPQLLDLLDGADIVWGEAFDNGNPVNGGDLVEWFAEWLPRVRTVIAAARGHKIEATD